MYKQDYKLNYTYTPTVKEANAAQRYLQTKYK